jgi:predicted nucleic acid-binding Zn ribbon protein
MTHQYLKKIIIFLDKWLILDVENFYLKPDIKCPVCKKKNKYELNTCYHCNYEISDLEKNEQFNRHKQTFVIALIFGFIIFLTLIWMVYEYYIK